MKHISKANQTKKLQAQVAAWQVSVYRPSSWKTSNPAVAMEIVSASHWAITRPFHALAVSSTSPELFRTLDGQHRQQPIFKVQDMSEKTMLNMNTSSHRLKIRQCHRSKKSRTHCVTVVLRCSKFKAFFRVEKNTYLIYKDQRLAYICILVVIKKIQHINCSASKNPFWLWRAVANETVCVPGNTQQNLCRLHPAWSEGCPDPNKPARRSAWSLGNFRGRRHGPWHSNFMTGWCQNPMEPNPINSKYCTAWNAKKIVLKIFI